jgi:hypothetical protein
MSTGDWRSPPHNGKSADQLSGPWRAESEFLVTALRPQTPKHIRGGWSHTHIILTPANQLMIMGLKICMVTVQSGFRTSDLLITGPTRFPTALAGTKRTERQVWIGGLVCLFSAFIPRYVTLGLHTRFVPFRMA